MLGVLCDHAHDCPGNDTVVRNVADPSVEELTRRIRLGEDSTLELKSIKVADDRVSIVLAAVSSPLAWENRFKGIATNSSPQ